MIINITEDKTRVIKYIQGILILWFLFGINLIFGQNTLLETKIKFEALNISSLDAVKSLDKKLGKKLAYSSDIFRIKRDVYIKKNTYKVKELLDKILWGQNIDYREYNGRIVLISSKKIQISIGGILKEEKTGEIIPGIAVMLFIDKNWQDQLPVRGTYTNKNGFYSLPKIDPGKYYIVASGLNYLTTVFEIYVNKDKQINLDLARRIYELDEVEITSSLIGRTSEQVSTVKINASRIKALPALGGEPDVFRALQLLPGIQTSSEISSGLYIRGCSPYQNQILLDGITIYNPTHLGGFLSTFNSDALIDVKLIKGAPPAVYGGRAAGVVDLIMKEGSREKFAGSAGISLINARIMAEGPISESTTFMFSTRRMYLDLILALAEASTGEDMPSYNFYDTNIKINHEFDPNNRLFFSGFLGRDAFSNDQLNDNDKFGMIWGNTALHLRWQHIVNNNFITNLSLMYTDYDFSTDIFDGNELNLSFGTDTGIEDITLKAEGDYFFDKNHSIKLGLELIKHNYSTGISSFLTTGFVEPAKQFVSTYETYIYLQDEWKINKKLMLNIGSRFNYFLSGKHFGAEPRISAAYQLNNNIKIKSAFSISRQNSHIVTRLDINLPTDTWIPATDKIKPIVSEHYVAGFDKTFNSGEYFLSGEFYYTKQKNLYEFREASDFFEEREIEDLLTSGEGDTYGAEFMIQKQQGNLQGWIGYSYSFTRRYFDELNKGNPFFPRHDKRHEVKLALSYQLNSTWEFGMSWVYSTGQAFTMPTSVYHFDPFNSNSVYNDSPNAKDYDQINNYRLPAFHKMDLNVSYLFTMFGLPAKFSINIYNLYNRRNAFGAFLRRENIGNTSKTKPVVKQITLFPIIPTFGLSFNF